jgi:hypothetical protein
MVNVQPRGVFVLLLCAALATATVQADESRAVPAAPLSVSRPLISLVWFDPTGALPVPVEHVAAEVQSLFASWDLDVAWRTAVAGVTVVMAPEVSVIVQPRSRPGRPDILGEVEPGQDARAAWVSVEGVMRALGQRGAPGRGLAGKEAAEFVTALARVVSHEIVHLAAPDLPHASEGLMRASLSRRDLTQGTPRLEAAASLSFRLRLARFAAGDIAA